MSEGGEEIGEQKSEERQNAALPVCSSALSMVYAQTVLTYCSRTAADGCAFGAELSRTVT